MMLIMKALSYYPVYRNHAFPYQCERPLSWPLEIAKIKKLPLTSKTRVKSNRNRSITRN